MSVKKNLILQLLILSKKAKRNILAIQMKEKGKYFIKYKECLWLIRY